MHTRRATLLAAALATALAASGPCSLLAQDPLTGVGPATEVRSIGFRFLGEHALTEEDLAPRIALTDRGSFVWLRKLLGWLPLISPVESHPFDPVRLQRDVVRLRRFYARSGFLDARIDYEVRYDADPDLVDVTFIVQEGPPLLLERLEFSGARGGPPEIAPRLREDWGRFLERHRDGGRLTEDLRRALVDSTARWLRNRGHPFAAAETEARVDSAAHRAELTVRVSPGLRARIREIAVRGNETVPAADLVRQLPVEPGDWYDAAALEQGRQHLMQLDLIRLALIRVPRGSLREDSTVVVELRVTENPPRNVAGEVGLESEGGVSGQAEWSHRSALGGLRTLTVGGGAQTGLLNLESPSQEQYRLAVSLFQPHIGDRRLSLVAGPFGEYRDDLRDRSWRVGWESSLVFADGPLRSIALGYTFSHRRILDYGFGAELDPVEYLPLLGLAEPGLAGRLGDTRNLSAITLDGSWGRLDRFANPRRGYVIRPRIEITTPFLTSSEYLLLELGATAFVPLNDRVGFTFRAGAGRIYPFGRSVEDAETESPFVSLLRLREATFTAGGTRDVRGWGALLLGPKLPEVEIGSGEGGDSLFADRYTPVGGLARTLASVELHLPVPGLSDKWQSFLFLDGARVWTPDRRFRLDVGELEQDRFFLGTGGGVGYETVVGAVQVALAYKLNPSALDVRDPEPVLDALAAGRPLDEVPTDSRRRWHLHFSIGATF